MIFVTVGTQDKSFKRLVEAIDKIIESGYITDEVVVQCGYTKYQSKNFKSIDFMSDEEFINCIKSCDLLITHGGVGSILNGIKNNKKVIAVPRLVKYKEHVNDHQLEIIDEFCKEGYILSCMDLKKLPDLLNSLSEFKPKKYIKNNKKIIKIIEEYINSL